MTTMGLGKTADGDPADGWIFVEWDHGNRSCHRIGFSQSYDLIIVEDDQSSVRPVAGEVQEKPADSADSGTDQVLRSKTFGVRVQRGPDWNWADQDQHGLGTTIDYADSEGWIGVKWDNGLTNSYRIGKNQCYDLMVAVLRSKTYGRRVRRGPDWDHGDQDQGGLGTTIEDSDVPDLWSCIDIDTVIFCVGFAFSWSYMLGIIYLSCCCCKG